MTDKLANSKYLHGNQLRSPLVEKLMKHHKKLSNNQDL